MNVITAAQHYIQKMIESVRGMKVLILDHETMGIVSAVFSQNEILQQEVYLFELLDTPNREVMTHLKAICFLRPTEENKFLLADELKKPKYEQYHLFFSNTLDASYIEELAHADEHEAVHQVQEYYADYFPVNPDVFSLNLDSSVGLTPHGFDSAINRICDGLAAVLLSLKRKPLIRYEEKSEMAKRTAKEMNRRITSKEDRALFNFDRKGGMPVLLIIDRKSDPVTPLLMQWTYQAMVHELMGIRNNRVTTSTEEIVLSALQDSFYKDNIYSNFGDLGINVKKKVTELQAQSKGHQNIQTIEDMKNFLQNFPEYQKLSGNTTKHLSILSEMSDINRDRHLYPISEAEQELVANADHSAAVRDLSQLLANPKIIGHDKLKLILLYALKYETNSSNQLSKLISVFQQNSTDPETQEVRSLIKTILMYGGTESRSGDLFGNKNWLAKAKNSIKRGMKEATNVYTQHKPPLEEQLCDLVKGKLSEIEFPALDKTVYRERVSDIIVFFVGGTTYEEALSVRNLAKTPEFQNVRLVLGGTTIHNSQSFLRELRKLKDSTHAR